jgi:hypothetical protein
MSGPPQGHLCGKTLLHTRGFGLKILHPITPKNQYGAQQHLNINKHLNSKVSLHQLRQNANKVKPTKAN